MISKGSPKARPKKTREERSYTATVTDVSVLVTGL
jgi:hypothetical protein